MENFAIWAVALVGVTMAIIMTAAVGYVGFGGLKDGKAGWWPMIFVVVFIAIIVKVALALS